MRLFRGSSDSAEQKTGSSQASNRLTRRSSSMGQLVKELDTEETLCILDLGSTSPANIRYCTERGHKIYSDDLLVSSTDPSLVTKDETGKTVLDSKKFLEENLVFPAAQFDIVLCWNLPDYLDESLVKPVVGRLWSLLKPGGSLLAFFHTQEAGAGCPLLPLSHSRHGHAGDATDRGSPRGDAKKGSARAAAPNNFRLQRVFNNRNIENLFRDFGSIKFFLARDNVREVLVVR